MGAICSVCVRNSAVDKSPSDTTLGANTIREIDFTNKNQPKLSSEYVETQFQEELVLSSDMLTPSSLSTPSNANLSDGIPRLSRTFSQNSTLGRRATTTKAGTKVPDIGSILGRAGTVGLGKAVEVLDTLGSSMTNLNISNSGFVPGGTTKGSKVTILAFEVANTIVKGSNLMRSLSKESIKHLKEDVLTSEGVQLLISKDMDELLRLASADKREEFKVFSTEVVRFGNRCKDPQWHNLDRYFDKLASEVTPQFHFKIEAESVMQQLMAWAQSTAELYHELHALDRFELDYRRMSKEESNLTATQRGEHLQIIKQEVKSQRKLVKSLKRRSLWGKNLEEVMEKLVDIVHFLHLEIRNAFGNSDHEGAGNALIGRGVRLGPAGLALHYANIITQIDTLTSRSGSIPASIRDTLYQGLPPTVKSSLRLRLHSFQVKEELSVAQIKAEMDKTLRWLFPVASNTTKAHHGFGWVGEWANTGSEISSKSTGQTDLTLIETLHHADKSKTESFILDLIVWLHLLISQSKSSNGVGFKSPIKSPIRSPTQKGLAVTASSDKPSTYNSASSTPSSLSQEDQEMLQKVKYRKFIPGLSRSQELDTGKGKNRRLCKSNSQSPTSSSSNSYKRDFFSIRRPSMLPVIDFNINKVKAMDMIDRVDGLNVP